MQDRQRLLSFVVVGGGPTGVEVAAELHDMIRDDLVKVGAALDCVQVAYALPRMRAAVTVCALCTTPCTCEGTVRTPHHGPHIVRAFA